MLLSLTAAPRRVRPPRGGTSAPANVEKRRFAPGFFLFSQENKNPALVHLDDAFATSPEMLPGTNSRRPKPGDIILLYGNGFGRTNPPSKSTSSGRR